MITLHWSCIFGIFLGACLFGFVVAAMCAASGQSSRLEDRICGEILDKDKS